MVPPGELMFQWARGVVPCAGEFACGDAVFVAEAPDGVRALVIDVSGHGDEAAALANELVTLAARRFTKSDVAGVIAELHEACRGTRGAACSAAFLDRRQRLMHYAALGNTRGVKMGWKRWTGRAQDGLLGSRMPGVAVQTSSLKPQETLVLYSDGLKERITDDMEAEINLLPARALVQKLLGTRRKSYDDAACVVIKCL